MEAWMNDHPVFVAMVRASCSYSECQFPNCVPERDCSGPLSPGSRLRAALAAAAALGAKMIEREPSTNIIAAVYPMTPIETRDDVLDALIVAWDAASDPTKETT
jgi:hypothetical protein